MKKTLTLIAFSLLTPFALAAGDHAGGHGGGHGGGHDMKELHGDPHEKGHDAGVGRPGNAGDVTRTITVTMYDSMHFVPDDITVKAGETIRFFTKNTGQMTHEMVIGSMEEFKEHAEMMRQMPDMQHQEANMVTLKPGQRGGLIWTFDTPGTVDFACLVPGHLEAGMVAKVNVIN